VKISSPEQREFEARDDYLLAGSRFFLSRRNDTGVVSLGIAGISLVETPSRANSGAKNQFCRDFLTKTDFAVIFVRD
jgi:hypothetical protein